MDRGIDASCCVGPAALRTGRVCGDGGAARGTRAGRRAWGGGRASSCASPRRCARRTSRARSRASERGPRRFFRGAAAVGRLRASEELRARRERPVPGDRADGVNDGRYPGGRFCRAPVGRRCRRRSRRTRAAGRVPSRPREFLLLVIQLLTHQFRSTRPCPPRTIRLAPVSRRPRRAAPQIFGSKCNKSGRRRSAPR